MKRTCWLKWRKDIFIFSECGWWGKLLTVDSFVVIAPFKTELHQNWEKPSCPFFVFCGFIFFFISVLVFFFFNSQFTAEKLQDINWLQCCLSKHQNQIYFLNICYLKKKRERKSKFTPIALLYLLFYTVYSNLLFYTVTPNVKKIHF